MTVIDYESIEEVSLDTAGWEYSWASTIPWVNSPMIDASTSVSNIPESRCYTRMNIKRSKRLD